MSSSWNTATLTEVTDLIARGVAPKYIDNGGVAVINQRCVRGHSIDYDTARRHDAEAKPVSRDRFVRFGDVLVNSTGVGTLGRVAQLREEPCEPTTVDTHVTIVRPQRDRFYPDFFGYMLIAIEDQLAGAGEGASGQTELSRTKIGEFQVRYPANQAEQKRIVAILDEAFECIAKTTANAERNASSAEELIDGVRHGLILGAKSTADFITLGDLIERGWITGHLDGNHGSDYPRKEEFVTAGVPYISANAIDDDQVNMAAAKYLTVQRADRIRKGVARNGDVLFAHNATVGPLAVLTTDEPRVILGTSLTYYRCDPQHIDAAYLAHYMRSRTFRTQYEEVMRQSTRNQVPITKQREFFHLVPEIGRQREIARKLDALDDHSRSLRRLYSEKSTMLLELRQAMLHKAFSGLLTSKQPLAA